MTLKRDAAEIAEFIHALTREPWLGTRSRLPLHLFRIDDVAAAVSILETGVIHSRNRAGELGLLVHDSASPPVIEQSPDWSKQCVRLYFRPKTPTEYRSEGFRPIANLELGAHRPMPVVFVFESIPLVSDSGTDFTNGNAATRGVKRGGTVEFLKTIPFEKVYHEGPLPESEKREIIFRRCAEVLVENHLELTHLTHILCRSEAEYETLVDLLPDAARKKYSTKIGISARVHYRYWTFVESANLTRAGVAFRFSPSSRTPGPFDASVEITDHGGKVVGKWHSPSYLANAVLSFDLRKLGKLPTYRIQLKLDGLLAYSGTFTTEERLL